MPASLNVDGIAEILSKIEQLGLSVEEHQNEGLMEAAKPVLDDAKLNLQNNKSIRTGKLIKSVKISKPKGSKSKYKYIRVFTKDPKAHLVELGHGGPSAAPAHPFLGPAFEKNKNLIKEIIREKLKEALK